MGKYLSVESYLCKKAKWYEHLQGFLCNRGRKIERKGEKNGERNTIEEPTN